MLSVRPPFITNRMVASFSQIGTGLYPIGFSLEEFLDLYYSVHSLSVSMFSAHEILSLDDTGTFLIPSTEITNIVGATTRKILPTGTLKEDGNELNTAQKPTTARDYPYHFVGGGGIISINFGKTLSYNSRYYPEILITFSNGDSSNEGGEEIGGIIFDDYGIIPIYRGSSEELVILAAASGRISVRERYSELACSSLIASAGTVIEITSTEESASFLRRVNFVYLGSRQCDFFNNGDSLMITIPRFARTNRLIFESDNPYNYWRSPFEIKII